MSELKLPELFGSRVFNEETMKERLSGACYQAWKRCVTDGASLELAVANEIAGAMKTWAVERGRGQLQGRPVGDAALPGLIAGIGQPLLHGHLIEYLTAEQLRQLLITHKESSRTQITS